MFAGVESFIGLPSQLRDRVYLRAAEDCNVVLQFVNVGGERRIKVFFTASIAQSIGVN